ncbi:MAG: hypothetical protein QOD77_1335 [Thermoplasmata archaeon]|nr:hypothetical protein [Thermoplasmata archaeon]
MPVPAIGTTDLRLLLKALSTVEQKLRGRAGADGLMRARAARLRTLLEYTNGHLLAPDDRKAAEAVLACWRGSRTTAALRSALAAPRQHAVSAAAAGKARSRRTPSSQARPAGFRPASSAKPKWRSASP